MGHAGRHRRVHAPFGKHAPAALAVLLSANKMPAGGKSGVPSEAMVENSSSLRWPEGVLQLWPPLA